MATWNEDIPALANTIGADVPDIKENLEFLALWAKERRSIFTYNGGTTAYTVKVKSGYYYCKDKVCWWDAELTTDAIGTPGASDWYYLYLDNSAITSGTEITKDELIWSNTEPAWNTTYAGWYNGDDRCIFAALTNAAPDNILEFFHDGNLIVFADLIINAEASDIDTDWTDVTLSAPKFATEILVTFFMQYEDGTAIGYWRTNGQTGTTGHLYGCVAEGSTLSYNESPVLTDGSQIIEIVHSASNDSRSSVYTDGWYFPIGL